ncbi:MAG: CoA transferase [Chloroflexi bacterium]|nr:CoA transferase [Chloroflexota bacterium]
MREEFLLSNIRVVEVGEGRVGPWAGLLLADLGAEVIKVESIIRPDMSRGTTKITYSEGSTAFFPDYPDGVPGERHWNRNGEFTARNLGKYGITLDLTRPNGLDAFLRLVRSSNVFLSNTAAGVAEKLGIAYEDLIKVNPKIIYLSSTGYGRNGPYSKRVAMGSTIDAAAGLHGLRDYGDGDSTSVSGDTHCDSIGALTNAFAILTAIYRQIKTGQGMFIDVSMAEASMAHIGEAILDYSMNKRVMRSSGNRSRSKSPQGCYRCTGNDQWVTLTICSDEQWRKLVVAIGSPVLAGNRFSDVRGRLEAQDEIDGVISSWTGARDKSEVMRVLQGLGIAAGAVVDSAGVYNDEHVRQRGFLEAVDQPDVGVRDIPGRLWKLAETKVPARKHAPCLGEHNEYVLKEMAGLSTQEIQQLERERIIGTVPVEKDAG